MSAEGGIQSEEIVKRCSFAGCDRPDESSHFYTVTEGLKLGGRDWSSLVGLTLCNACYTRFLCKGTLEKSLPILKRCSYEGCPNPTDSKSFTLVEAGCKTGNRDWTPLLGRVLCKSCMVRYGKRGTLERTRNQRNKPLAQELRRCTYSGCVKPDESSKYVLIEEGRTSGRQDWSPIVGNVLCTACYMRYKQRGTLKRCYNKDITSAVRRCSYAGCDAPEEGSNFYQIQEGRDSGGHDWSSLTGSTLCETCYTNFNKHGTLKRPGGPSSSAEAAAKMTVGGAGSASNPAKEPQPSISMSFPPPPGGLIGGLQMQMSPSMDQGVGSSKGGVGAGGKRLGMGEAAQGGGEASKKQRMDEDGIGGSGANKILFGGIGVGGTGPAEDALLAALCSSGPGDLK